MSNTQYIYLHGFASGPKSTKARAFAEAFGKKNIELTVPDLNGEDFKHLTVGSQLKIISEHASPDPKTSIRMIGSSLGGFLSAVYATREPRVESIFIMAPAFQFFQRQKENLGKEALARWESEGYRDVFHYTYDKEVPLSYDIVRESVHFGSDFPFRNVKAMIMHGFADETVPWEVSLEHARRYNRSTLKLIHADHSLIDPLDTIIEDALAFFALDDCP